MSASAVSPTVLEPKLGPKAQPQSKSNQDPERDDSQRYILRFARRVRVFSPSYLTLKDETNTGITVVALDLRSDDVSDGGPRFVKPASRDEIKDFVERNRPWERYDLKPIHWDEDDDPKRNEGMPWVQSHRSHTAGFMLLALRTFAEPDHSKTPDPSLWFNDEWRRVGGIRDWHDSSWKRYRFTCFLWAAELFMVPRDTSKPHVNAFMVGGEPLRDDALSTGEVAVATGLIAIRRCYQKYNGCRYIPVTIFSASDRQIRIVQVWHDREKPRALHVRRSPIMEFWEGAKGNWEDWITILCWMMGNPVLDDGVAK